MADEKLIPPEFKIERDKDFVSRYANNVFLQPSAWDLQIVFSQIDQVSDDPHTVQRQHTVVTIPWAQAKVLSYWLQAQVGSHEIFAGKIPLRPDVIPSEPKPFDPEREKKLPRAKQLATFMTKLYEAFIATVDVPPHASVPPSGSPSAGPPRSGD